jgi:hypothetical protein
MRRTDALSKLFYLLGLALSILPPAISTLLYFPVWRQAGGVYLLSGMALLLLLVSVIPFMRFIKEWLKSPSAIFIWTVIYILFFALSKIAEQVTVIAFFGLVGNILGAIFFRLSKRGDMKD